MTNEQGRLKSESPRLALLSEDESGQGLYCQAAQMRNRRDTDRDIVGWNPTMRMALLESTPRIRTGDAVLFLGTGKGDAVVLRERRDVDKGEFHVVGWCKLPSHPNPQDHDGRYSIHIL